MTRPSHTHDDDDALRLAHPSKNIPWTYEENTILLKRVSENIDARGRPRWAHVAKGLDNRTPQEARCRYRRIVDAVKRKARGEKFRNVCHLCGQTRRGHVCTHLRLDKAAATSASNADEPLDVKVTALPEPERAPTIEPCGALHNPEWDAAPLTSFAKGNGAEDLASNPREQQERYSVMHVDLNGDSRPMDDLIDAWEAPSFSMVDENFSDGFFV